MSAARDGVTVAGASERSCGERPRLSSTRICCAICSTWAINARIRFSMPSSRAPSPAPPALPAVPDDGDAEARPALVLASESSVPTVTCISLICSSI